MLYLYIKALHIIFVVTWFAGLFYIVRLFIYHVEAKEFPAAEALILQKQLQLMQRRLWYGITWPSCILTLVLGLSLLHLYGVRFDEYWLWGKLTLVFGLILYHWQCGRILQQQQRGVCSWTSTQLRIWNEVATLFLVGIVFLVVLKDLFGLLWGVGGLMLLGTVLMGAIHLYRHCRKGKLGKA